MRIHIITKEQGGKIEVVLVTTAKANFYAFCNAKGNLDFKKYDYYYQIWENEELLTYCQFHSDSKLHECLSRI